MSLSVSEVMDGDMLSNKSVVLIERQVAPPPPLAVSSSSKRESSLDGLRVTNIGGSRSFAKKVLLSDSPHHISVFFFTFSGSSSCLSSSPPRLLLYKARHEHTLPVNSSCTWLNWHKSQVVLLEDLTLLRLGLLGGGSASCACKTLSLFVGCHSNIFSQLASWIPEEWC